MNACIHRVCRYTTCSHESHADADLCVDLYGLVEATPKLSNALPTTFVLVYVRSVSLSRIRRSMGAYLEKIFIEFAAREK